MGNFNVALIIELIDTSVEHDLKAIKLRNCTLFFISELIDQLSESLVVVKVTLIVSHIRVKFDFLLMLQDS